MVRYSSARIGMVVRAHPSPQTLNNRNMNSNVAGWIVVITFVVCVGTMITVGLSLEAKGIETKKRHVIESNNSKYYTFIKNGHQYLAKDCVVNYDGYKITSFSHDGNCKCNKINN